MNIKKIAAVSLTNRDFSSFEEKLIEAVKWVKYAARLGSELVVLPEALNLYKGDGPVNANTLTISEVALSDWKTATQSLIDVAEQYKIAVTIPVFTREKNYLTNSFFLISKNGEVLGDYRKMHPTVGELAENVRPGIPTLIEWEGLKVGGAICFDSEFQETFATQSALGADFFLMPSLWPGGDQLNYFALRYSTPIIIAYPAWSRIIDITGKEIASGGMRWETLRFGCGSPVIMADINFDKVALTADLNEEKIMEMALKYGEKIKVSFEQQNTTFFLESLTHDFSVRDIMKEFELESRNDFLKICKKRIEEKRNLFDMGKN